MIKYSNLKFNQSRDRFKYSIGYCLNKGSLSLEDEMFLSSFHKYGVLGSHLFDLVNDFILSNSKYDNNYVEKLYGSFYDFCNKTDEYEVNLILDSIFFHNSNYKSPNVCTLLLRFVALLDSFYGDGIVEYIDHTAKKVVRTQIYPGSNATLIDLGVYCLLRAQYDLGLCIRNQIGGSVPNDLVASKSNYTLVQSILGNLFVGNLTSEKNRDEVSKHALNCIANYMVLNGSGHYKTSTSPFKVYTAFNALWDREDFLSQSSESLYARLLIDFCKSDLLKYRTVLLREKGVIIRRRDGSPLFDNVNQVCLREDHCIERDIHNVVITLFQDQEYLSRELVLDIKNIHSSKVNILFGIDLPAISLLYKIAGLNNLDRHDNNYLKELYPDFKELEEVLEVSQDNINKIEELYSTDDLIFEEPTSWNNYSKTNSQRNRNDREVLFSVMDTIGNYTRNLPAGSKPSQNAIDLAKAHCMELPDGKTFVSEFTRKRKVYAKNMDLF